MFRFQGQGGGLLIPESCTVVPPVFLFHFIPFRFCAARLTDGHVADPLSMGTSFRISWNGVRWNRVPWAWNTTSRFRPRIPGSPSGDKLGCLLTKEDLDSSSSTLRCSIPSSLSFKPTGENGCHTHLVTALSNAKHIERSPAWVQKALPGSLLKVYMSF